MPAIGRSYVIYSAVYALNYIVNLLLRNRLLFLYDCLPEYLKVNSYFTSRTELGMVIVEAVFKDLPDVFNRV